VHDARRRGEPRLAGLLERLKFGFADVCYDDCDHNLVSDLFDFLCFINAFDNEDDYADCDENGVLDLFDFLCFTNAFNVPCV
jgi:hypothetical protein